LIIRKRNQTHAPGTQQELIDWFTATSGHLLSQSQVSKILGPSYDYLNSAHTKKDIQKIKGKIRSSGGDWPDLDHALFKWQQRMEQKKAIITGEILVKQVKDDTALRAIETVKLWKLQKGTDHDIKALDRIEREIVQYKSSQAY
jgi:hypothetical protein